MRVLKFESGTDGAPKIVILSRGIVRRVHAGDLVYCTGRNAFRISWLEKYVEGEIAAGVKQGDDVNTRSQVLCAWCGILCPLVAFGGVWLGAGFLPPHLPMASALEIAAIYQQNATGIRVGMVILLISGALYLPFTAAITVQMRRIETRATPVLTCTQFGAGISSCMLFIVPALIWTATAFRPERNPDITQAMNDFGWFFFVMPFILGFTQNLALGFAIISDINQRPVFPRWVGYFNFWIALLFVPGGLVTFFRVGPFAWNGLLAFWVPVFVYGPWFFVVSFYLIRAARQQAAEAR